MHQNMLRIRPQKPRISCVVPAYNEALNLPAVLPAIGRQIAAMTDQFEIIVVNDGSRDNTLEVANALAVQHPEIVVLDLSRNFGKEAAITAGLEAAVGDVVILMDADGQHPTTLLPTMLEKWQEGLDVVYAIRRTRNDQSTLHAALTAWFYRLVNWGSRVKIPRDAGDFRLMDKRVVAALVALPERNRFMKGLTPGLGFPTWLWTMSRCPDSKERAALACEGLFVWR